MNLQTFEIELKKIGVKESILSIYKGLQPDSYILENNSGVWKSFYYDEKGETSNIHLSLNESDAFKTLLNVFKEELKLLGKFKY